MSAENLSIIFAPTCVRLDGVGQLLSNSSSSSMEKVKSSPMQKPVKMFRTLSLRKTNRTLVPPRPSASQATLSCDKISPHSFGNRLKPLFSSMQNSNRSQQQLQQQQRPIPKYEPRDLLQLSLVKESGRWNKFFQFMIENAPKFNYTRHYSPASSLEDQQMAIYNGNDNGMDTILVSTEDETDSNHSLTSPKVRRIKDIFGSMLSMFPDIAQDLNISMSPTTSPTSRTHHNSSARTPPIRPSILNEPEPNVLSSPSSGSSFNKRQQKPHHTALLPPPAAATVSRKRNSSDTWTPPMASLRRTMTADTSSGNNNDDEDLESPTRFIGTKYEAIWQHWKEREDEERYIPTLELKTNLNSLRSKGDWLKSLSQNADFAAPTTNKRPMSVAFIPSARPNYFLR
ncbi:hypothetical protein INT45_011222 [Circinella minor]|uniref:Uncharacterized protein n=1 Tax=Circinella minor TaxID=1195481 RepID=A0A8H7S381_9FUNG|nr:hypothetical protein INT45_011222 [Circinella minor]